MIPFRHYFCKIGHASEAKSGCAVRNGGGMSDLDTLHVFLRISVNS
jgi:hypothetical protein